MEIEERERRGENEKRDSGEDKGESNIFILSLLSVSSLSLVCRAYLLIHSLYMLYNTYIQSIIYIWSKKYPGVQFHL